MLSAVINMITHGTKKDRLTDISHAVLVEAAGTKTSTVGQLKEVLSKFAPHATFTRMKARHVLCDMMMFSHASHSFFGNLLTKWLMFFATCCRPETEEEKEQRHLQYSPPKSVAHSGEDFHHLV